MYHADDSIPDSVWVEATINSLMTEHRKVNVSHQPVSAWDWPEMTMDFSLAESVDLNLLKPGTTLRVKISKTGNEQFKITDVRNLSEKTDDESLSIDDLSMEDMNLDDLGTGSSNHDDGKK